MYNDGWAAARAKVSLPSSGTGTAFSFKVPPETVDGNPVTYTYTIAKGTPSASGGYASVNYNGAVVGRISISDWWEKGYEAGCASVPDVTVSSVSAANKGYNHDTRTINATATVKLSNETESTHDISVDGSTPWAVGYIEGSPASVSYTAVYNAASKSYSMSITTENGRNVTENFEADALSAAEPYDAGKMEGASNVTVTAASAKFDSYLTAIKYIQGTVTVALSNGKSFDRTITLNAKEAFDAGYTAGLKDGAATVTLEGGEASSSNIAWSTTIRKIGSVTGTVTVKLSNGNSYSRTVSNITAPSVNRVAVDTDTNECTVFYKDVSYGYIAYKDFTF